ncbi:MAG TPA: DUF1800 family protein, partial [Hanamia sp.]|nr:DUF1800 family protein [Hanamia sp.]
MPVSNQQKNQHLLWRAAFGPMAENANQLGHISQKDLYQVLVKTSSKEPVALNVAGNMYDGLIKGLQDIGKMQQLSKDQKRQFRKQSAEGIRSLNILWLDEMINSQAQLREKMSLF